MKDTYTAANNHANSLKEKAERLERLSAAQTRLAAKTKARAELVWDMYHDACTKALNCALADAEIK